jgi:hypothetical protein
MLGKSMALEIYLFTCKFGSSSHNLRAMLRYLHLPRVLKRAAPLLAAALLQWSCASEERADFYVNEAPREVRESSATTGDLQPITADYPEGPYGSNNPVVGDTLEDLKFFGFHRLGMSDQLVSEADYGETSFSDYRDAGVEYLLIHVASAWCSSCLLGAVDLQFAADQVVAVGGELLELVVDGQGVGVDPNKEELELWIDYGGLQFTTTGPGQDQTRAVFPEREHVYIVDLKTMKVVWTGEGLYNNPSVAQLGLEQLLGKYLQD